MLAQSRRNFVFSASALAALGANSVSACAAQKRIVNPARMNAALSGFVADGRCVGASALIWEKGREAYFGAFGQADRAAGRAMSRDAILQIFSMTKPIVGVGLMRLHEQGLFKLDDPIAKHIPEFADLAVFDGVDADGGFRTRAPLRAPTVLDFMRHTAGLATGETQGPLGDHWRKTFQMGPFMDKTTAEYVRTVASIPLERDPGTAWRYGDSVEIQAVLIERLSGKPLAAYLQETVFDPLKMRDTGYLVPGDKRGRFAAMYTREGDGPLADAPDWLGGAINRTAWTRNTGGFGLTSTLDDYMRFARMLLNGGSLDGARILTPETIRLMATDHLGAAVTDRSWLTSKGRVGFGIDFAVRTEAAQPGEVYGHVGEFFWDGLATTIFWVDPANDVAVVFFTQVVPYQERLHKDLRDAVYDVKPA